MRIEDRIPAAVSRWRDILEDRIVADRMPRSRHVPPERVPDIRQLLDDAVLRDEISALEREALTAIALNPERDQAEMLVLMIALSELVGRLTPRRVLT